MILEIVCFSIEAAILVQEGGADRIELCSAPAEGGLTPSIATIATCRELVSLPVHVLIRPREGDFLYTNAEFNVMIKDIEAAGKAGIDGIVAGILHADGCIDTKRMQILRDASRELSFTFHRAFDMAPDPFEAMEILAELGMNRVLTSGCKTTAAQGIGLINDLAEKAGNRISVMPGGGIHEENIELFARNSRIREVHLSAARQFPGAMKFRNPDVLMGGGKTVSEYNHFLPDVQAIRRIKGKI